MRTGAATRPSSRRDLAGLGDFSYDLFMLAHREADGIPEWHEDPGRTFFFVQSGDLQPWL
jgi:hypothetical protein